MHGTVSDAHCQLNSTKITIYFRRINGKYKMSQLFGDLMPR